MWHGFTLRGKKGGGTLDILREFSIVRQRWCSLRWMSRPGKILTMSGIFHKKGNVDCLYLKRNDGERGLMSG